MNDSSKQIKTNKNSAFTIINPKIIKEKQFIKKNKKDKNKIKIIIILLLLIFIIKYDCPF